MSDLDWLLLIIVIVLGLILLFIVRRYLDTPVRLPLPPSQHDSDAELLALVDALPVGVLVTDSHSTVLRCNAAAATLLDLSPEAVVGRSLIHSLRDYELAELLRRVLAGVESGPELNLSYNHRYLLANVSVLGRKQHRFGLMVLQDVTQIHRVEQVRRDFVANVSHEFRTPLATAKLLVETAQTALEDDPAAAQGFLNKVNRELDSLTHLVSELLDLSRIEAGQTPLQLRPVALKQALELAASRAEEQAARHGLHLDLAPLPDLTVMADETRLGQVVGNLVQNAIKFTPAGGSITVSAARGVEQPFATVSVADTGIGIPHEDLERVFERFYKVDRARSTLLTNGSEQGGTGLGLAIARHIVSAQGGRIWAESDAHGATFHFTVPLAAPVSDLPAASLYISTLVTRF
jgi:two-component system, OmpR family, phosphate regulon sensor histidine kinase PhoR